jgi:hypothetical protein
VRAWVFNLKPFLNKCKCDQFLTNRTVMGIKTDISYSFKSNRLYFGVMHLKPEFDDLNDYIKLFHSIKNSLVESLGYPTGNEEKLEQRTFQI